MLSNYLPRPFVIAENKVIPNGLFWSSLTGVVIQRSTEYSGTPIQDRCAPDITHSTSYGGYNYETNMLMLGLMALSWLTVNMKKKTELGHCRNPIHKTTKNKIAGCSIGSECCKGKKQAIVSNSEMLLDNEVRLRFSLGSTCQQDKIVTVRK